MNLKISRIIDTYTAKLASIFISEIKLAQDRFKFNHYCNLFFCILCITLRVLISNSSFQRIKFAVQTPKTFQKIGIFVLSVTQYSGLSTHTWPRAKSCTSQLQPKNSEGNICIYFKKLCLCFKGDLLQKQQMIGTYIKKYYIYYF